MPVPYWIAKVNRRVFNPMEMRRGERPILTHVGRTSGAVRHTPLDAHEVEGGYLFFVMYGADRSDWVQNIFASGTASLGVGDTAVDLHAPRLIDTEEAQDLLSAGTKFPPGWTKVTEYLRMDRA